MAKNYTVGSFKTSETGDAKSIKWLNVLIKNYTNSIYGPFGYSYFSGDKDIEVMGMVMNTKYIDLMSNNRSVFRDACGWIGITNEDDFYRLMQENLHELFHYDGKYFNAVLETIMECVRKGNLGEKFALKFLQDELYQKTGVLVQMMSPTLQEDMSGIDGKFEWGDRMVTVQVKPYSGEIFKDGQISAYSSGALSIDIKGRNGSTRKRVDYLALYNLEKQSAIIVRGENVAINGNFFVFPQEKVISRK